MRDCARSFGKNYMFEKAVFDLFASRQVGDAFLSATFGGSDEFLALG